MNSTPQSQNSPPIGTNPFVRYYEEWSERTPLVTKYSVIGLIVSYMISLFLYFFGINFDDFFTNEVEYTVYRFEIYRLILSPFVGNNIIMVIFIIIFFVLTSSKFENSQGSLRFLFLMGTLTLLTNISFILISLICYLSGVESAYEWVCAGFWNVCFPLITMECMLLPDQPRQLLCIPYEIPSKYYPLVLYLLFGLITGFGLDSLLAMLIGYLYSTEYLDRFKPTSYFFEGLEASGFWYRISRTPGWVLSSTMGHDAYVAVNQVDRDTPETTSHNHSSNSSGSKRVFGFNDLPSAADEGQDNSRSMGGGTTTSFPGAGHKLVPSSTPAPTSGSLFKSSIFAPPQAEPVQSASLTREDLQAKRLAALGLTAGQKPTSNENNTSNTDYTKTGGSDSRV